MGKEKELLEAVRTKNVEQARKIVSKLKKTASGTQNKKKNYIDIQDEHGFSILHHCALHGYADVLKDVIDLGGSVSLMDNKGMTPLHMAAFGGRYESCQVLLMRNADPNAGTRTGDTPLHIVSIHGYAKIAEVLINERANCNLQNVSGQTPLDLACENGNNEIVSLLLNTGQCVPKISGLQTPVHLAAKQGHVQCLRLLVGHGYSVNTNGANGTPLHEAALYGKTEAVKFLIEVGADVTIPNNHGLTPLEVINRYTDPRSGHNLKLLLQGAVENAAKMRSETPSQPLSRPPSSRSHHQVQSPSDPHPPYSPNQPPPPSQPHPHHQQQSLDQPPNWKPEEPRGYAIGGNPSLAAMIAAKAASRKPMVTSPTKKENTDHQQQQQPYSSAAQLQGYESYQNHQHPTTVLSPHYHPPPTYGTKPANSQQASHTSQPMQYGSQQISYSSEPTKYTSQQASHISQPVQYTSQQAYHPQQQAYPPQQQASHTSQLASQQTSHISHPEGYPSHQTSHTSHPERYTSRQASHTSQPIQYASQQTSHTSHAERYAPQQTSHTSHPERYGSQQASHTSHPERYASQQASHTSHPERYASQQASHTSHPERYTSQQASHTSHPERYASQQASHTSHPERYTSQQTSHASQFEGYTSQQASHTSHPAQAAMTTHSLTTTGNVPSRSASMRYATSDSDVLTNPVGYLPGSSYTTEHIGKERSSSGGPQSIVNNELLESQSRSRSYTVHDTPANNTNHSLQRPAKKPKPTPSIAKDDSKSIGQPNRSISVESTSDQLSAPPDTIQLLGQAGLRKSGKRPVPVPQKSTEPNEDNELMQKLRRRQHKIEEAQVTPDQQEQVSSTNQTTVSTEQSTDHLVEPSKTDDKVHNDDREQVTAQPCEIAQYTTTPSQYTTTPSQYAATPSQYTATSSQYTAASSQYTATSSQNTTTSSQYTTSPSQYTTSKPQYTASTTTSSTQYTTNPAQYTANPAQYTTNPAQYTANPVQHTANPAQYTTNPAQYTANPAQHTANPAQYTTNPAQYTANQVQYTANQAQYTTNPAQYTANQAQHTANPAQYTTNPAQYTANQAQHTVNSSHYNSTANTATIGSVITSASVTADNNQHLTNVTTTTAAVTTPTIATVTTPTIEAAAVTTPTIAAVTMPTTVVSTPNDVPATTTVSTSVSDNNVAAIKRSPVLEKKSATAASTNDVSQSKITRSSTPPSSAANTNLTAMDYASGLSITSSLSSSSISSASTNPAAVAMTGSNVEAIAISEWLIKYKLSDYITIFQQAGFDNTDFIAGITAEELIDIGVTKIGHRKKIMTAVQTSQLKEPILTKKPASVKEWLSLCGLIQYHQILLDAGYDDIDFIADITRDELIEVGVSKYAHLKRLMKSIGQLLELTDSGTASASSPTPSSGSSTPVIQATNLTNQNVPASSSAPTTNTNVNQNLLPATSEDATADHMINAADHMINAADKKGITRQEAAAMDPTVTSRKGPPPVPTRASSTTLTDEQRRRQQQQGAMVTGPPDGSPDIPPVKMPPKVAKKPKPNKRSAQPQASTELEYLEDDIIAGLGKDDVEDETVSELTSDLDLALQGFGDESGDTDQLNANKMDSDDLFGELDDMLADLNAQLNVIIPTSST